MAMTLTRELNALNAIASREVMRLIKNPGSLIMNIIFPIIFLGIMGGSLSQNLAGNIGYDFLQFVMIGMIAFNMYMGTASGVTSMVVEREMNLTQELYVSPISRYTIMLGKMIGTGIGSLVTILGVIIVALFMHIPFGGMPFFWLILVTPAFSLVGGSLGIFFIGFVQDSKLAQMGVMLLIMPQMFFSGTIIPITNAAGILAFLTKIMPLTYVTDLARGVFYWGDPVYDQVVLHHPLYNFVIMAAFFLIFTMIGTIMFTKAERNR